MDVEIEHPHHHHHKTGSRWLDLALPLSALLISIVSIAIAFHHGQVMQALVQQNERLVQANSLPYVEIGRGSGTLDGKLRPFMMALNTGVGPAHIRSVQIKVDGRAVTNPKELFAACCDGQGDARVGSSTLLNRMIPSGKDVQYLMFLDGESEELARRFLAATNTDRIQTSICYCSVFEECWINSSNWEKQPERVESCPMPEPQYRF